MKNTKTRKPLICLQKLINSSLMKLKSQTRYAQTVRFFNVSFRLNLEQFFPNDSLVYDVFGLFQCTISKTGNLLLFQCTISNLVNLLYLTTLQATLSSTPHPHQHPHSTHAYAHTPALTPTPSPHSLLTPSPTLHTHLRPRHNSRQTG